MQWTHDAGNQTTAQLTLTRGSAYYVTVRAYNASAQVGPPSNEATINLSDTGAAPTARINANLQSATTAFVTWSTTDATSATINGADVGLSGSMSVPISATTTYTLVATNSAGATATWTATVTMTPPGASAPTAQISGDSADRHDGATKLVDNQRHDRDHQWCGCGAEWVHNSANLGDHDLYAGRHRRRRRHSDVDRHCDRDASTATAGTSTATSTTGAGATGTKAAADAATFGCAGHALEPGSGSGLDSGELDVERADIWCRP